jgi:hypothetical protein
MQAILFLGILSHISSEPVVVVIAILASLLTILFRHNCLVHEPELLFLRLTPYS